VTGYGDRRGLATNQKVAGSSPAERAPESPANAGISSLRINLKVGLCHLTHHLAFSERLRGVPVGTIWMFQFLTQSGYIIQLYLVPGYNNSSGGIEHCVFRWRKAPVSTILDSRLDISTAEQRAESYIEIVSEVRIKGRLSLQYPWEQD
jgi:hypothetical protein